MGLLAKVLSFGVFVILQAIFCNGFYESMNEEMILNGYKKWLKKRKMWIGKPLGLCVQCSSSALGAITFWPVCLMAFGFHWQEVPLFLYDIFILVYLNFYFFKKL